MAPGYEVEARLAAAAEKRGDALAAVVRWGLAAHAADTDMKRVAAIGAVIRDAELALHQAVHTARTRDPQYPPSWRALASAAGVPVATLNRRYRRKPPRPEPKPLTLKRKEVERLMEPGWEPDEEEFEWALARDLYESDEEEIRAVRQRTPGVRTTGRRGRLTQEE